MNVDVKVRPAPPAPVPAPTMFQEQPVPYVAPPAPAPVPAAPVPAAPAPVPAAPVPATPVPAAPAHLRHCAPIDVPSGLGNMDGEWISSSMPIEYAAVRNNEIIYGVKDSSIVKMKRSKLDGSEISNSGRCFGNINQCGQGATMENSPSLDVVNFESKDLCAAYDFTQFANNLNSSAVSNIDHNKYNLNLVDDKKIVKKF